MKRPYYMYFTVLVLLCFLVIASCKGERSQAGEGLQKRGKSESQSGNFRIRYRPKWQTQAQFAGVYMAIHKGIYDQYGLDVKIQNLLQTKDAVDSLRYGNSDVIHLDLLHALEVVRDSTWIVNIGQIAQKNSLLLVGKRSRGINSLEDFRGKKLGKWRSGSYLITELFLKKSKIPMEIIPIDWSISLFTQNVVDVINAMRYNEYHQILQAGIHEEELFVADLSELGFEIPDEGFYVSREFYKSYPRECGAFVRATMDGWLYAFSNPDETIDVVIKRMQDDNQPANKVHQRWMLDRMKEAVIPSIAEMGKLKEKDLQNALSLLTEFYYYPRSIPYTEFYPNAAEKRN